MDRKLYIAYGSNLSVEQMDFRCPDATIVGAATLADWRLVFRTHADIEPCKGSSVPVLVWSITEADERNLDRYEGFPHYYIKRSVPVTLSETGRTVLAMVYVMAQGRKAAKPPTRSYYNTIAEGYDRFGFDKTIFEKALQEVNNQ